MHSFIPKNIIKKILEQVNIINIVKTYIQLKKKGNKYYALCPFHNENHASFFVNEEKQYFYCFGCNTHGNSIDFLMKYNQITFIESIYELSKITNIKIQNKEQNIEYIQYTKKQKIYNFTKKTSKLYHKNLQLNHSYQAKKYLKKRNINNNMIQKFYIGFSYKYWYMKIIKEDKNYFNHLIDIKIIKKTTYGYYDYFENRIIFPIINQFGDITGFGGRSIHKQLPKYINSSKNETFNKGYQLYGINYLEKNKKKKYILVVEGYFDVISLTQHEIKNVVSPLGTMITQYQIKTIFQFTNQIIFCYDGDDAGKKAAWRTIKIIISYLDDTKSIKFIFLTNGEDPDSIIHKEGKKKFEQRIKKSIHIFDVLIKFLFPIKILSCIEKTMQMINKAIPLINKIPSEYKKNFLKKKIGYIIGINDTKQLEKILFEIKKPKKNPHHISLNNIRTLISLIIQNPDLIKIIPYPINDLKISKIEGLSLFIQIFQLCQKYKNINTGQILELYRNKKNKNNIYKLSCWENMIDKKKIKYVFIDLIEKMYKKILDNRYHQLMWNYRFKKINLKQKKMLWKIHIILSM
ncbi:DNA primase [Buchnera aphidicola]|uniref:DNA primase n=1 Tax=Buchnera aphidicola TaxID=9 RepID=UPI003463C484